MEPFWKLTRACLRQPSLFSNAFTAMQRLNVTVQLWLYCTGACMWFHRIRLTGSRCMPVSQKPLERKKKTSIPCHEQNPQSLDIQPVTEVPTQQTCNMSSSFSTKLKIFITCEMYVCAATSFPFS